MGKTVKILHLINGQFYAGGERVQDLLSSRLPEFGYEVVFVCLREGIFSDKRQTKNVQLHSFPTRSMFNIGLVFRLVKLARQEGCQLIHTHTRRAVLVGQLVSKITGLPMVHHLHSPSREDTEDRLRNIRNTIVEKISLQTARKIIPVSGSLERYLIVRGYKPDRIRPVWNGVPVQELKRVPYVAGEPLVVGMVALFRPRKGVEVLLDAIAELRQSGNDVRLHAVGPFESDDYRDSVEQLVDKLELGSYVHWTGFTNDVVSEFKKMHVFALPSLFGEGMPMVVLEAMAAGLPVVSTLVEGIPEVVRDGEDGLLVESGNPKQLAEALGKLASGEVNGARLGDSGRQRQIEHFSDLAMADGVASVYRETLTEWHTLAYKYSWNWYGL